MGHHQINAGKEHAETAQPHAHHVPKKRRRAFTLIELLIVIGIVAILAAVVVLVLNPAQLLAQARDSNRMSDLQTIGRGISLYTTDRNTLSLGSSSIVYVSLVDQNATTTDGTDCAGFGLPILPNGWGYHCAASSTHRNVDGTGWIPVNLTSISTGAPFGTLPIDPKNTAPLSCFGPDNGLYYTYVTDGRDWVVTVSLESMKYMTDNKVGEQDGGVDPVRVEIGSNRSLWKQAIALVGYWKLDDISATPAINTPTPDSSPSNITLNLTGGNLPPYRTAGVAGKINGGLRLAPSGTGGGDANIQNSPFNFGTGSFGYGLWVNFDVGGDASGNRQVMMRNNTVPPMTGSTGFFLELIESPESINATVVGGGIMKTVSYPTPISLRDGNWHHFFAVLNKAANTFTLYIDGVQQGTPTDAGVGAVNPSGSSFSLGYVNEPYAMRGVVDEARIYKAALKACEVQAIYDATK